MVFAHVIESFSYLVTTCVWIRKKKGDDFGLGRRKVMI